MKQRKASQCIDVCDYPNPTECLSCFLLLCRLYSHRIQSEDEVAELLAKCPCACKVDCTPSDAPSGAPTVAPSQYPSMSESPSQFPTSRPSHTPSIEPSSAVSATPSESPSIRPTTTNSNAPTQVPSTSPLQTTKDLNVSPEASARNVNIKEGAFHSAEPARQESHPASGSARKLTATSIAASFCVSLSISCVIGLQIL